MLLLPADHYQRVKPYGSLSGPMSGSDLGPNCLQSLQQTTKVAETSSYF